MTSPCPRSFFCRLSQITCYTVVGAGASLAWFVTIDGQASVSPTTAYGVPVVGYFSGPGARDASTDGGDAITIYGQFFSTAVRIAYLYFTVLIGALQMQ